MAFEASGVLQRGDDEAAAVPSQEIRTQTTNGIIFLMWFLNFDETCDRFQHNCGDMACERVMFFLAVLGVASVVAE